jgi:TonB dependent receptor
MQGFQHAIAKGVILDVSQNAVQNFSLQIASSDTIITVESTQAVIESTTMTVGQVINNDTVQEIPLNGRHFVDLASLVPGTVVPPVQNAFLTAPLRGQGAFAIVTAGNREDTTNFQINGINLNDMANGQITFQPSINTVSEFKIDNSTYSAEYGRSSGSIVNIATRSGTNEFHGEGFEFLRNEKLDARNFFNQEINPISGAKNAKNPFKRNQFGAALGGPIWKDHTFFFGSYEGLRQRQGLALTGASIPSPAQQAQVTDPTIKKLLALLPSVTGGGSDPTVASNAVSFLGSAVAPVNIDQWTGDVSHNFGEKDRLHGYYVFQRDARLEPNLSGATVPGAGDARKSHRQIMTFNETHVFTPSLVNDFRLGYNRIRITFLSDSQAAGQDPSAFGIMNGLSGPIGLPHFLVSGIGLQFGGEQAFPQGRGDYTAVLSDAVNYLHGKHNFKFGGEFRRFNGNSIAADEGTVTFTNIADFLGCLKDNTGAITCGAARPSGFTLNGGNAGSNPMHPARIFYNATGLFAMDSYKVTSSLTLELGLRWEWIKTPTEAVNRNTQFNPATDSLVQVGTNGLTEPFGQNNHLFQPRVGFAWDIFHHGKVVLRSGYGLMYDQLLPGPFIGSGNLPFGKPVSFTPIPLIKPFTSFSTLATDAGGSVTIGTTNPNFKMPYVQSYNVNLQTQITRSMGMMIGYFGSKGTHLEEDLNINQITNGVRPFQRLSASSPVSPGQGLGNITQRNSIGTSHYDALWITGTMRLSKGLQFNTNYTWSKSLDEVSRNFLGAAVQDSLRPFADYGPSDFDARHHFIFSGIYAVPAFRPNRAFQGWRLGTAVTLQSGNPLTITANATSITGFTGIGNIRPDLMGTLPPVGTSAATGNNAGLIQYFPTNIVCDPRIAPPAAGSCTSSSVFAIPGTGPTTFHFGNLGRNVLIGPGFSNVDFSVSKTTKITERLSHELRVESFDLLNHPNFSNPGTVAQVGSTTFGVIRATRGPTGDAGSSRQIQFAMKLIF